MKNNYLKKFDLKNKIAIVVGGFGRIGFAISKGLLDAGAKVIVIDQKKIKKDKKNLYFVKFDCKNYKNFKDDLLKIKKKFGTPSIYVNASYPATNNWASSTFEKVSVDILRENIDLHLNSYTYMAKTFADLLKSSKRDGSIIQISSIYGIVAQNMNIYKNTDARNSMIYPIIKGGINNFSKQLASYYGKHKIRANNICPGGIDGKFKGTNNKFDKKFSSKYKNQTLLKRFCKPEDVACAAIFLASDASSYITGIDLMVDGGWTAI